MRAVRDDVQSGRLVEEGDVIDATKSECLGRFSKLADLTPRNYLQTGDHGSFQFSVDDQKERPVLSALICACGNKSFELIWAHDYEASAKCWNCNRYYVVHAG